MPQLPRRLTTNSLAIFSSLYEHSNVLSLSTVGGKEQLKSMVKAYLRYEQTGAWGVITSANVCYDKSGKHLLTASLENVSVWNVKQAVLVRGRCPDCMYGFTSQQDPRACITHA